MKKTFSISIMVFLIAFSTISAFVLHVKAQSLATITGTVLYNGEPISEYTSKPASFWVRDEINKVVVPVSPSYDPSTGIYSIADMPPGEYGISVYVDDAEPYDGRGFAGDFDGWESPVIVPEGESIVYIDLPVERTIHLTSPVDNRDVIGHYGDPKDTYLPEEIVFRWDAIPEASYYNAYIWDVEEPYTDVRTLATVSSPEVEWRPVLPPTEDNRFYEFDVFAYNPDGVLVGKLMLAYENALTSGYRFRIHAWDYVFEDLNRATMLKVSIDEKLFLFVAPDVEFSIREADKMVDRQHMIYVWHEDNEIRLVAVANTRIDFCHTFARDRQTDNQYLLIDKPGIE